MQTVQAAVTTRERVRGLDGVRGLAALYVVLDHVFLRAFPGYPADHAPWWAGWLIYGRFAVVVFIVLSGFSLALGPARDGWRPGDLADYARRRARRILPAYWAALALSLLVAWLVVPPPGQPAPTTRSVVVDGLLLQDLVPAPSPNRALWSIAVEAQLYVALPLLLLAIRRRGPAVVLASVTAAVAVVALLAPHGAGLRALVVQAPPDLAALFTLGVVAAGAAAAAVGPGAARRPRSWSWTALLAAAPVLVAIAWLGSVRTLDHLVWVDLALGPAIACLLVAVATGQAAPLRRLLDTRPLRRLGGVSYSLYLVHAPVVVVVHEELVSGRVPRGAADFLVTAAVAVPAALLLARGLAGAVEWRFRAPARTPSWSPSRAAQATTRTR